MITIRLLGGARRALGGRSIASFEKPAATVSEILLFLQQSATEPRLLDPVNLIIAVNGVDSAALDGPQTIAKNGDTVTVVTVVHGGTNFRVGQTYVAVISTESIVHENVGRLIDSTRRHCGPTFVQVLDADCVFGVEHIVGVMRTVLEVEKRGIMVADKVETELLIRVAFNDQISEALSLAGMKSGSPCCFVGFSKIEADVKRFTNYVLKNFAYDEDVLKHNPKKKKLLAMRLGLSENVSDEFILENLLERGAILAS